VTSRDGKGRISLDLVLDAAIGSAGLSDSADLGKSVISRLSRLVFLSGKIEECLATLKKLRGIVA
jgi:hypothetical protein